MMLIFIDIEAAILHLAQIPVETTKLCVGMYVSMLDRPWLETPFVFQGFEIKDRHEIEQLQSYCSLVFIDVDKGRVSEAEIRALVARDRKPRVSTSMQRVEASRKHWLVRLLERLFLRKAGQKAEHGRPLVVTHPITATVRSEAPRAREAYEVCAGAYLSLTEQARRDGVVDLDEVRSAVAPIIDSVLRNPDAMAWTVFTGKRSSRNYSRAVATSVWSTMFGRHLGFDPGALEKLAIGGLLLDIGNVELPEDIVHAEGAITLDQFEVVRRHVNAGLRIVQASGGVDAAISDMIRYHHERFDGSGYPIGKKGSEIPIYGRIAAIADYYDAMTTRTSYTPAMAAYDAARELKEMRNRQFHGEVVDQFLHTIGMFPTGSVVELSDETLGLVLEQNRSNPLRPKVILVRRKGGEAFESPRIVDMQALPTEGEGNIWIARGHEHGAFGIDPLQYFN
jgi:HD-GYP domain-containing protein (c-di-GMP phosphodiesterase class II)